MRRRSIFPLLLLLLTLPASAQGQEERVAREVVDAFARGDRGRLQLLAAEPAARVSYPRVVDGLLRLGQIDAAEALARERQGPEAEGLQRVIRAFKDGRFPTKADDEAFRHAALRLKEAPEVALTTLDALRPADGTVFAVDVSRARVAALDALGRRDEMRVELRRLSERALAVGDWRVACLAEEGLLKHATNVRDAEAAAEACLDAARRLDDRQAIIEALRARARVATYSGTLLRGQGNPAAAQARWKEAREDYLAAAEAAEKAGDMRTFGQCWLDIGRIVQELEGQPGQGLKAYQRALTALRGQGTQEEVDTTVFLTAIALTELARYDDALARLEEILAPGRTAALRPRALAQRAYVLGRASRLRSAPAAYREAIEAATEASDRVRLLVQAGDLHLARQDPRAAERYYADALEIASGDAGALAGRARALALRGDEPEARAAFDVALKRLEGDENKVNRGLVLDLYADQLLAFGRRDEALSVAFEEVKIFTDISLRQFGNAGAAWKKLADLTMLDGNHAKAAEHLAKAATIFYNMQDPSRAIDLYAQEMLLMLMLGREKDATERLQVMANMAGRTPSESLKSVAKSAEAVYEAKGGRGAHALELLDEAQALARQARDPVREATALVNRALLDPGAASAAYVRRALALLDAERLSGPAVRPLIQGYSPDWGPGIGLHGLLASGEERPEDAFALLERALGRQRLLALGGRDAILVAALTDEQHAHYVDARANLVEARATGKGVEEAEGMFDAMVAQLRSEAPAIADIAWPPEPPLADVREALRNGEALLMALFDPYVSCALFVDRQRTVLRRVDDPSKLFDDFKDLLEGKNTVMLACGGAVDAVPMTAHVRVCHVPTAAAFLRLRTAKWQRGDGVAALGPAPERFGAPLDRLPEGRLSMLYVGRDLTPLGVLAGRFDADTVVVESAERTLPFIAGALLAAGARNVVVGGRPPGPLDIFLDGCLDRKLPVAAAFREAGAKGRLLFYGPPE